MPDFFVYLREPLGGGCTPKWTEILLWMTEVLLWMGVKSIGTTTATTDPSDTDPGEIGRNPAPPSFWLRNPLDSGRLGKINKCFQCDYYFGIKECVFLTCTFPKSRNLLPDHNAVICEDRHTEGTALL